MGSMPTDKPILVIISIAIVCAGLYMCVFPRKVSSLLKSFYSNYPLVKRAGDDQLLSRPVFLIIAGISFVAVGVLCVMYLTL